MCFGPGVIEQLLGREEGRNSIILEPIEVIGGGNGLI